MKNIVFGILAHVDAGKTTLTESLLYLSGAIRKYGRVDHGDAFFDYDLQERNRGITIFSKQVVFDYQDCKYTLIDTPGHVDFSSEMERTLQVLDYAILVISGLDGIQPHSETIWKLLEYYQIPTFIFVNKMDTTTKTREELINSFKENFSANCFDFDYRDANFYENIALNDEKLLDYYLENQTLSDELLRKEIAHRQIFPVYFGSALKNEGIEHFFNEFTHFVQEKKYPDDFGARVFKITHDKQGNRLTHLKVTGGKLKVKESVNDEKIDQIRIYSGDKYQMVDELTAGSVGTIKGFKNIQAGDGLGFEKSDVQPILASYMDYQIILPDDCDQHQMIQNLMSLAQEDPQLHLSYDAASKEIHLQLMGPIQIEILQNIIFERFKTKVTIGFGKILYKETIAAPIEGVGHYEPLRHYSEVHLLLEPLPAGSSLQFALNCQEEMLPLNYQHLVLTHLQEKEHLGVLTGSPITDMKITLIAGRAHQKHTEGGDFREATYRAVRHGLKRAQSILLEPYFDFTLKLPVEFLSRAIYDIEAKNGKFSIDDQNEKTVTITGQASVRKMQDYQNEVISYTKGQGQLICHLAGYQPCLDQDKIVSEIGYDSESDLNNPTGSIFCSRGAGFNVKWDEVANYMHIPYQTKIKESNNYKNEQVQYHDEDEELEAIFLKTYGVSKRNLNNNQKPKPLIKQTTYIHKPECILVDGYNLIYTWPELKELARDNLDAARMRLIDLMCNYQGYKKCILILVFDAYKVKGNLGTSEKYHNIYLVYTKEAQTADMYIERTTHELASKYDITVVTSDALEQLIVLGQGGKRISSRELYLEATRLDQEKLTEYQQRQPQGHNYLLADLKDFNSKE